MLCGAIVSSGHQIGPGPECGPAVHPAPRTYGNFARAFFTSPNFFNLDAALSKSLRMTERFNVELRTDRPNSTNHPDFATASIDTSIDSSTFGRFTGAGSNANRIVVLGGRVNW